MPMPMSSSSPQTPSPSPQTPQTLDQAVRWILSNNFDADSRVCFLTLLKVIDNVLQKPGNDRVRTLRVANKTISSKIIDKQGHHVLLACGFSHEPSDPKWRTEERFVLRDDREDTESLIGARHTLARIAALELGLKAGDIPPYTAPPVIRTKPSGTGSGSGSGGRVGGVGAAAGFDVYAGNRFDGQSAAVGTNLGPPENWKSKTEQELAKLKQREALLQKQLAAQNNSSNNNNNNDAATTTTRTKQPTVDRQWTVFLPGQSQAPPSQPALSSAEAMANSTALKLTPSSSSSSSSTLSSSSARGDSQLLANHFKQQAANRLATENRGFTTRAMRDLEKLKKARVYSHTQLAMCFPDGLSVRANFATHETLGAVITGLAGSVLFSTETLKLPGLELYQTPPRRVLDPTKSLKDLGLVPAAKVYVSWKTPLPAVATGGSALGAGWYIRQELLSGNGGNNGNGNGNSDGVVVAGPVLPTAVPVLKQATASGKSATGDANTSTKRKKTKAEKEAALMKRMLGK